MSRITDAERERARRTDPTEYLRSMGYTVRREGRHLSVRRNGEELYRLTFLPHEGRWVRCDKTASRGDDVISLVREIEDVGYVEAVRRLLGLPSSPVEPLQGEPPRRLRLPPETPDAREAGRAYLRSRGISDSTIKYAEAAKMVHYTDGGVLFVGRDPKGKPRCATRRATNPDDPTPKRDLAGSDKSFPPILPGSTRTVWIVEGGLDALAVHDLAVERGVTPPTVIVSGGAMVRSFLEREHVRRILAQAERVVIACEREASPEAQERTDEAHRRQAAMVAEITGRDPVLWRPPPGCKALPTSGKRSARPCQKQRLPEARQAANQPSPEEPIDFTLPGLLTGTVGLVVAPGATGKSWWALQAAAVVASGADTLGLGPVPTGKAVLLSAEDPPSSHPA